MEKLKVGIVGATGMVGQRFITLLHNHPWFEIEVLAASPRSAGMSYEAALKGRWAQAMAIPERIAQMQVYDADDVATIAAQVDFVFCAIDMDKAATKALEDRYAQAEVPVVSNNAAHRWTEDVPMVIPEINPDHLTVIEAQKARLGTKRGFVAVKPNCSIQSYVPVFKALEQFEPTSAMICTYQAISGAGKTFDTWPEMLDNVIPFIGGEEEKSEKEPLKIFGHVEHGKIVAAKAPVISAQCIRVPVLDGHLAAVSVNFKQKPDRATMIQLLESYQGEAQKLDLPSAPKQFIQYRTEENRPQTHLDRDYENGMGISVGRLREDHLMDYQFVCLSHNTLRGAAGGAVLIAELLKAKGYITKK